MNPTQLVQLAALLEALQLLNQRPNGLYVGEAVIYNANDQPIAKLEYNDSGELTLSKALTL